MLLRRVVVGLALISAFATHLAAESTDCGAPVLIVADGRSTQSLFPQNATYWYGIYALAGHSYSVEFVPQADNFAGSGKPQFSLLAIFGPNDSLQGCRGTSSVPVWQNSGYAPVILKSGNGAGRRISFITLYSGLHLIAATNVGAAGAYTFRAVETTLFSPLWSTAGGNDFQWNFLNVSDMPLTGILNISDTNGQVIFGTSVTIQPGARVTRSTGSSDINLGRNVQGSSYFAHNGPPHAVLGDGYVVNSAGIPSVPVKIETLTPQ